MHTPPHVTYGNPQAWEGLWSCSFSTSAIETTHRSLCKLTACGYLTKYSIIGSSRAVVGWDFAQAAMAAANGHYRRGSPLPVGTGRA
jgi:hypothetical protein